MASEHWPFNNPQSQVILNKPKEAKCIWSRGTGKSFLIAWLIHIIVRNMPRASWAIIGKSYKQILTRTLPSTIFALENYFGYKKDKDFFVRRRPPVNRKFDRPLYEPNDYEHCIIFKNGCCFHLVSLDGGGSTIRGLNIDGYLGDEALEINKEKMDPAVVPTNRGQLRYYGHVPWHHGNFFFSSMGYGPDFKWMLEAGDYYLEEGFNFRAIREEIVKLQLELVDSKDKEEMKLLWNQIREQKKQLKWHKSKEGVLYIEADIFDNLNAVGWQYLKQQRRALIDFVFMVEILNWFPEAIDGGYYAALNRKDHGYQNKFNNDYIAGLELGSQTVVRSDCRMDADLVPGQPLRGSVDWGGHINSMTVAQHLTSINTLRFIKEFYVKDTDKKILDDLALDFCHYYHYHDRKEIFLSYGHDGNNKLANSHLTYVQQFAKILEKHGWTVYISQEKIPLTQQERYLLWNRVLRNTSEVKKGRVGDPLLPLVEFNLDNCPYTFVSMQNAPVKEGPTGIEKNKKSERNESIPQEEATHLSDTADYQLTSVINNPFGSMPKFIG